MKKYESSYCSLAKLPGGKGHHNMHPPGQYVQFPTRTNLLTLRTF